MAIFHLSHKTVGRSTHAAGTAGAHADYIEREQACRIAFGEHMPTKRGHPASDCARQPAFNKAGLVQYPPDSPKAASQAR